MQGDWSVATLSQMVTAGDGDYNYMVTHDKCAIIEYTKSSVMGS